MSEGFELEALSFGTGIPKDKDIEAARAKGAEIGAIALLVNEIHQTAPGAVAVWNIQAVTGGGDLTAIVKYYGNDLCHLGQDRETRTYVHSVSGSLSPLKPAGLDPAGLPGFTKARGIEV